MKWYKHLLLLACGASLLAACSNTKELELEVMSFNIRYDEPNDGTNSWDNRKDQVLSLLKFEDVDLLGTQEVLHHQLLDISAGLPDYTVVGVGREDGFLKGEYSAILFKKDRFDLKDSGTFWLSETPHELGSKGWDGACERVASWALLTDKASKRTVFFINTHLDHVGVIARHEGVNLLLSQAKELAKGAPVIITGDFNAEPESDVIQNVLNPNNPLTLVSSHTAAINKKGVNWTFHGYDKVPLDERQVIDYIFVSSAAQVLEYEVLPMQWEKQFISDHCPILAKIKL